MKKHGVVLLRALLALMLSAAMASASWAAAPVLDKPEALTIQTAKNTMDETVLRTVFPVSPEIRAFKRQAALETGAPNLVIEYDMRLDGGKWFMDRKPGQEREESLQAHYLNVLRNGFLAYNPGEGMSEADEYVCDFEAFMFELDKWDLENHVYACRYRFVYEQYLPGRDGPSYKERVTPWSDEAQIGK